MKKHRPRPAPRRKPWTPGGRAAKAARRTARRAGALLALFKSHAEEDDLALMNEEAEPELSPVGKLLALARRPGGP